MDSPLSDSAVLDALRTILSPQELSLSLAHLLRVPAAWSKLHDPAFIERVIHSNASKPITPSTLIHSIFDDAKLESAESPLPETLEFRLQNSMQTILHGSEIETDFESIALLAVGIARQCNAGDDASEIANAARRQPQLWKSPLCCAWTWIHDPQKLLHLLLDGLTPEGVALAANMFLANMTANEAAGKIIEMLPNTWKPFTLLLRELDEAGLVNAIVHSTSKDDTRRAASAESDPEVLLTDAIRDLTLGEYGDARERLDLAWKATAKTAASIADHIAETAYLEGDGVLEIEARKQALRSCPSPRRRADLALTYVDQDRPDEVLSIIDQDPQSIEEQIALGNALVRLSDTDHAIAHLRPAAIRVPTAFHLSGRWLKALSQGLQDCGDFDSSLQIARAYVNRSPYEYTPRAEYIGKLSSLGDHTAAAEQAALLLAIHPQANEARQLLAINLQESGAAHASLTHWKELASDDPSYLWDVAECALQANEATIAEETAINLLKNDPDSVRANIVLGRAHSALGRFESALKHIQRAVEIHPDNPRAWIALAETKEAAGDSDAAAEVLSKSIGHLPEEASLYAAQAAFNSRQGLLDESRDSIVKAVELDPDNVEWLLRYGAVLDHSGQDDAALSTLKEAHSKEPYNWRVRTALGKVHEHRNEHHLAAELLSHLPADAPAEAHYLAGRVIAKSGEHSDMQFASKAVEHLQIARDAGIADPNLEYWMARAQEYAGENELAFQNYQSSLKSINETDRDISIKALMGTARTALATGRLPIALTTLETAQEKFPASTDVLTQLSRAYLSGGMPEQSLHVAQQAVEIEPGNADALNALRDSAVAMKEWNHAMQATQRLLEDNPGNQLSWLDLARYAHNAERHILARDSLSQALAIDRRNPKSLLAAAKLLIEFDEPAYALVNLRQALARSSEEADFYAELAETSQTLGDIEIEQKAWMRLLEFEPDNLAALTQGARALWNLDRHASAIGLWQRAIQIDGDNAGLNLHLGRAYFTTGETQRGLDHVLRAYKLAPGSADLAKEAGNSLLRFGSPLDALEVLQRAVQLSPNDIDCLMDLGKCYLQLGRFDEAEHTLSKAREFSTYPLRADALLSQIALTNGDLMRAEKLLQDTLQASPRTTEDTFCIAETAMRLGHWDDAINVIEETLSKDGDVETLLASAKLRLRIADTYWLYATLGAAQAHAPIPQCASPSAENEINSLIERIYQAGAAKRTVDRLKRWSSLTFDSISIEDIDSDLDMEISPGWSCMVHALAIFLFKTGNPERAIEVIESDPDNIDPDAWGAILLGLCHTSLGDTTQAIQAYNIASRNMVVQPLVSFLASDTLWQAGEIEDSLSSLNLALSAWPNEVTWHTIAASRYQDQNRFDAAVAHLQQAAELDPDDPENLHALAHALKNSGQLSEALVYYEQLIERAPERKSAWKEAAEVAMANGKAEIAQTWFERASTLYPSDPACLIGAARAAMSQGKTDQAMSHIDSAARMAPKNMEVLVGMGEILASQGKYEKALRAYDQAIKSSEGQLDIRVGRCKLLLQIGRPQHAIAELHTLLEAHPRDEKLHSTLAEAYERAGDLENAIEAATQATLLSPRDAAYRYQVGRLCRLAGQLDRALDELLQAQSTTPDQASISRELGQVHEQRREIAQALDAYRRALELDPRDDLSHYRAGLILKQQKAYPQAARLLERAIELNPKDTEIIQQLAAVRALELVHGGI
ncbi:MAG: tetratricopeptide repeat protein [Anaerolineales bacterium]